MARNFVKANKDVIDLPSLPTLPSAISISCWFTINSIFGASFDRGIAISRSGSVNNIQNYELVIDPSATGNGFGAPAISLGYTRGSAVFTGFQAPWGSSPATGVWY